MTGRAPAPPVRLAELVATLSLVSDLGMGMPMEHALRQCLIALRLGDRLDLTAEDREAAYYAGLLAWIGCHVDAYEQAKWFGNDLAVKADIRRIDLKSTTADLRFTVRNLGLGQPLLQRVATGVRFVAAGGLADSERMLATHCDAAGGLARGLGLGDAVHTAIEQTFERWDGRGDPHGAKGEEILLVSRLVNLADVVEVYHRAGGVPAAVEVARDRSGTQFDPEVVDAFCGMAEELFAGLEGVSSWSAVIEAEPGLARTLDGEEFDGALEAIADFTDVKSPFTVGHSRGVADLAGEAARTLGLPEDDAATVRQAGLVHDLGRMGVPNSIWEKEGELTLTETERVRLHPYLTERTLASSPCLAPLAALAVQHHERLDGSGYPRGLRADALSAGGRVLGAADLYRAKTEARPHRPAVTAGEAAAVLRAEVRAGRIDGDAAEAVLRAAGHRPRQRRRSMAGLTPREVEVLRLLARGLSTKQIAHELGIARKTAGNHVEHVYTKLGVGNRALACLAAGRLGLLDPPEQV